MSRRRRYQEEQEESVELQDVLEPYEAYDEDGFYDDGYADEYAQPEPVYQTPYNDEYAEEYSEEHEAMDHESRFHLAIGFFNLVSILLGVVVILVLVSMIVTLVNWLRSDILHSALFLQSGLH